MKVCVYYESNEGDITAEVGATTDVAVFGSMRSAVYHLLRRVAKGKEDGFVYDEESDLLDGERLSFGLIHDKLRKTDYAGITMFFRSQGNWQSHYDCVIERKEITR